MSSKPIYAMAIARRLQIQIYTLEVFLIAKENDALYYTTTM
jgi:hypothetical protein